MMMRGGMLGNNRVLPLSWVNDSTTPDADYLQPTRAGSNGAPTRQGYAYQWWIPYGHEGAFNAEGIYGQSIYVNPTRRVVIVQTSAWPTPLGSPALDEENSLVDEKIAQEVAP